MKNVKFISMRKELVGKIIGKFHSILKYGIKCNAFKLCQSERHLINEHIFIHIYINKINPSIRMLIPYAQFQDLYNVNEFQDIYRLL